MVSRYGRFTVAGATIHGVRAFPVDVEVVVSSGLPAFSIVGMPDAAIHEARERIKAAIGACGFKMPGERVVVNLAPGTLKKSGSGFDLPIAVALLAATSQINPNIVAGRLFVGELSLEGKIRPVPGLLAYAMCARAQGIGFACSHTMEGMVHVDALDVVGMEGLSDLREERLAQAKTFAGSNPTAPLDFKDIAGHAVAKRALQIAAAGSHGVLMMGPPGSGKTMLASRMPSILPPLSKDEALETAVIHSVASEPVEGILGGCRPFRHPHHSASLAGLVGGGNPVRPGEVTLAHNGVLFLDELAEFKTSVLQGIRQPMESGRVTITRADGSIEFPARFALVAASNPCPCGYFGDDDHGCRCSATAVRDYQARIGGPVLDRIDIHLNVRRLTSHEVLRTGHGTDSATLRDGVMAAREFASWRRENVEIPCDLGEPERIMFEANLGDADVAFLEEASTCRSLSGRSIMRMLAVARTIADIEEQKSVKRSHICEAMELRMREGAA